MQEFDVRDLKKRIADQIELIQGMSWDGEDTTEAKEALRVLQDTHWSRGRGPDNLTLNPNDGVHWETAELSALWAK